MILQEVDTLRLLLCSLGDHIRDSVINARRDATESLSAVSGHTEADTIYAIDKFSEDAILSWMSDHWPSDFPCRLVMEGIEDHELVTFPQRLPADAARYTLILDPIDGTRGLMYDKRPAWALAAIAKNGPSGARLRDVVAAAMTELPTRNQMIVEQLSCSLSDDARQQERVSINLVTGERTELRPAPSQATDLRHGFACVAKYFPAAKRALVDFELDLLERLIPARELEGAIVFDDQYISTGGQLFELIAGHDRLTLDLRPYAFRALGLDQSLSCHPYDICCAAVAQAMGVIVEAPDGSPLDCPLDTTTPVCWAGYANEQLADAVRPHLRDLLRTHFNLS